MLASGAREVPWLLVPVRRVPTLLRRPRVPCRWPQRHDRRVQPHRSQVASCATIARLLAPARQERTRSRLRILYATEREAYDNSGVQHGGIRPCDHLPVSRYVPLCRYTQQQASSRGVKAVPLLGRPPETDHFVR